MYDPPVNFLSFCQTTPACNSLATLVGAAHPSTGSLARFPQVNVRETPGSSFLLLDDHQADRMQYYTLPIPLCLRILIKQCQILLACCNLCECQQRINVLLCLGAGCKNQYRWSRSISHNRLLVYLLQTQLHPRYSVFP